MNTFLSLLLSAIIVGTWNGNWFPSGRAEHRAHPDVEAATSRAVARMLSDALATLDPEGTNEVVLCLNEIRGNAATNLIAQIGRTNLCVAALSAYRRRDRFDQQQDLIATTLPVVTNGWAKFAAAGKETPPRGYAFAELLFAPAVTGKVYAVHLKSNYRANKKEVKDLNRAKRTRSVREILALEMPESPTRPVLVAGDMNADPWRAEFKDEEIFTLFEKAGFLNLLALLPPGERGTHPSARYGDSALDFVFSRGFSPRGVGRVFPNADLSDHQAFLTVIEVGDRKE